MVRQGNFERDLGGRCDMNSVQVGYSGECGLVLAVRARGSEAEERAVSC